MLYSYSINLSLNIESFFSFKKDFQFYLTPTEFITYKKIERIILLMQALKYNSVDHLL